MDDKVALGASTFERTARCPACAELQEGLVVRLDGKLRVKASGVEVLGFICGRCLTAVHWGKRGKRPKIRI